MVLCSGCSGWCARVLGGGEDAPAPEVFAASAPDGSLIAKLAVPAAGVERGAGGAAPVLTLVEAESSDVLWEADVSGAIRADGAGVRGISFCTSSYALRFALLDGGIVEFNLETKASTQVVFETQAPDGSLLARLECPQLKGAHRMLSLIEEASGATLWQNDVQHALAGRQVDSIAFDRTRFVLDIHDAAGGRIMFNLETKEAVPVAASAAATSQQAPE
jgi:hypothetical protein